MKLTYVEEGFRLEIGKVVIRFTKYKQLIDDICIGDHPSTLIYLYNEMAIEFIEKMEELERKKEISKETLKIALDCFRENKDISEEFESKKEMNDIEIAKAIREAARYQRNFKATIKNRIKENNGQPWIKDFSKNYYWEDVLKNITGNTKQWEITPVLKKYKIKFNTREEELYINMEPTQGHYSECEEFFRTVDGETFKLRWDYHHEEILEISRP